MTESLSRRRPPFAILIATTATGPLAMSIILPSMPGLMGVFDGQESVQATSFGYATVQLTLTLVSLGVAGRACGLEPTKRIKR